MENTQKLVDTMDKVATTGDGDNDLWLYVTRDFENEEDESVFMLSLESSECIMDSETVYSAESMEEHSQAFINRMEKTKEEQQ